MLIHALGCLGAALSMSLSWPQVYKSCVQRRTNGLSATASTLGVALPLGWITYGLLSGERLQIVPQPLALVRDRGQDLSGLSPMRWRLGAGASASWLLYGLGTGQEALLASASIGLISTSIVCAVLFLRRERTPPTTAVTHITPPRWRDSVTTRNLAMSGV
nr:hypothetical protein [uncultured Actinoplanes sp.]